MSATRQNPYERLADKVRHLVTDIRYASRRTMWVYPAATICEHAYVLGTLAERVRAAEQLGWNVQLRWLDSGLVVEYVKPPELGGLEYL
jgi:hypothetical protein